jgi:hypothetical protein
LFDRTPHNVDGPGGISMSLPFRGNRNAAAGCMMTVTLVNDVAAAAYVPV